MSLRDLTIEPEYEQAVILAEEATLVAMGANNAKTLVSMVAVGLMLASLALAYTSLLTVGLLLIQLLVVQVVRVWVEVRLAKPQTGIPLKTRMLRCAGAGLLCSLSLIVFLIFLIDAPIGTRSILSLILLLTATAVVGYVNGHPIIYRTSLLSLMLPVALFWLIDLRQSGAIPWNSIVASGLILIYGISILNFSNSTWAAYVQNMVLRVRDQNRAQTLDQALKTADAASTAKTKFLAVASHDLRQPLHTISLLASILKLRHGTGESAEVVQMLDSVVISLGRQLDDLLDISKLDSGILQANKEVANLGEFLRGIAGEFEPLIGEKNLVAVCRVERQPTLPFDTVLLARVIRNLMSNALKFTKEGTITLGLDVQQNAAIITITDTGCGIAPAHQQDVFTEFFQVDNAARTRSEGLGLGLAIVKRLCTLMDIEMKMTSALERGTKFELRLAVPSFVAQTPVSAPEERFESELTAHVPLDYALNVLVVDDEPEICAAMRILLEELGCTVKAASSTTHAVKIIEMWHVDLVVADYRLSADDNGIETIKQLQQHQADVAAVLISGDTAAPELLAFKALGIPVLHKPVSLQALAEQLDAVVQHRR